MSATPMLLALAPDALRDPLFPDPLFPLRGRALESDPQARDRSAMALEERLAAAMRAAQDGDAGAYRALLRDCLPVIRAAVRAQGLRGEAVEDAVQDALVTLHRARASYDPARAFLPWLRAIAQRRAIDALRRAGRRPREVYDPAAYEGEPDARPEPGAGLEAGERAALLARAVAALPAGQRQAIEELALRERSLDEAAALTGRSKGALKVNLHRAIKALRASLVGPGAGGPGA